MWRVIAVAALAGCNSLLGIHQLAGDAAGVGSGDAAIDAMPTIDGSICLGSGGFMVCLNALPTAPVVLSGILDTNASVACTDGYTTPAGQPWCVAIGTDIAVSTLLQAVGTRPLVLVATGNITIDGTLDASSHAATGNGAGANPVSCAPPTQAISSAVMDTGGGAGAGGSFGSSGGAGGNGDGSAPGGNPAPLSTQPMTLVGGCPGGDGAVGGPEIPGDECQPTPSDPAGSGGGAVYLLAEGGVTITGHVAASGQGGGGGHQSRGGGSGGGSGGLIVVWSTTALTGSGTLVASGGGGGGGADHCATANPGSDPPTDATTVAAGGMGNGGEGAPDGANGGAGSAAGGKGTDGGTKGGSAGGGGVGFVLVHAPAPGTFPGSVSGITGTF